MKRGMEASWDRHSSDLDEIFARVSSSIHPGNNMAQPSRYYAQLEEDIRMGRCYTAVGPCTIESNSED
jgi:hypothetical protein